MDLPSGTITLVFTDIQDSSEYSERYRAAYEPVRALHFNLLRDALARWNGHEVSTAGDALFVVFATASDAVQWAVDAQRTLASHEWPVLAPADPTKGEPTRVEVRIRIGMHTGEPFVTLNGGRADFFGPVVNRAARVSSAAYGGQVLISDTTRSLVASVAPAEISFRDCGRHRLKGVGEEQLWQVEAPGLEPDFPPLKTFSASTHNLPVPPTPYLGRENEIRLWLERLRDPATRLLTLTGFGGLGKTRTALHLAEVCLDEYPDGVWWIAAEEAHTGEELLQRIATSLRLPLHPDVHVRDQVYKVFRERSALIVLDNLEQVSNGARAVKDLLVQAPKLKLIVTSRRALEIQDERVVELNPMAAGEAAQLFVNRVRDRQPAFELTDENRADVEELCCKLDGVPLALELAASRIAMLAPRQMLQRLNERFKLLQSRSPDLPDRQRALRGAIDWSYDLLSDDDKSLFIQASVFAGGFTVEDAEVVCDVFDVLEGVAELRIHSLLRSETDAESQSTRFTMFNSLREYAQEKLQEAGSCAVFRLRHVRYFAEYAAERLAKLRTAQEAAAMRDLDQNADNLRAGTEYATALAEIELFARLSLALGILSNARGFTTEALSHVQAALDRLRPERDAHLALFADLLDRQAWMWHAHGVDTAESTAREALQIWKQLGDRLGEAQTQRLIGYMLTDARDYAGARAAFAEALAAAAGSPAAATELANIYNVAGLLECTDPEGDPQAAAKYLQDALTRRRALRDARGLAETLNNLGVLSYNQRDWAAAAKYYSEGVEYERSMDHWFGVARSLYNLAEAVLETGETERAIRLAAASERLMDVVKSPLVDAAGALLVAIAEANAARIDEARRNALAVSREALVSWALDGSAAG